MCELRCESTEEPPLLKRVVRPGVANTRLFPLMSFQSCSSSITTRAGFPTVEWCCASEKSFQI